MANMADIWVALKAQEKQVPIVCGAHEKRWLTHQVIHGTTIWESMVGRDKFQTQLINEAGYWNIHVYKPKLRRGNLVYG